MSSCFLRTSNRQTSKNCNNDAEFFDVELLVVPKGSGRDRDRDISMLAGQYDVYAPDDEKAILTARTSKKPET